MSVELNAKDGSFSEGISNGGWAAIIAFARAYDSSIPDWNGSHDDCEWTPEHLKVMADRLEAIAVYCPILRDLVKAGGVRIS